MQYSVKWYILLNNFKKIVDAYFQQGNELGPKFAARCSQYLFRRQQNQRNKKTIQK